MSMEGMKFPQYRGPEKENETSSIIELESILAGLRQMGATPTKNPINEDMVEFPEANRLGSEDERALQEVIARLRLNK